MQRRIVKFGVMGQQNNGGAGIEANLAQRSIWCIWRERLGLIRLSSILAKLLARPRAFLIVTL